eukprot:TRINITY_DN67742_c0_g1_i1.p1 TRINITY_DN67742_c0_g1~~TRINITY_DN67742_c0_g1_i1.p1  ORF type:complete len:464 (-),score=45.18 TRINITY_DN67742_c0_g1_i1:368-1759(-)
MVMVSALALTLLLGTVSGDPSCDSEEAASLLQLARSDLRRCRDFPAFDGQSYVVKASLLYGETSLNEYTVSDQGLGEVFSFHGQTDVHGNPDAHGIYVQASLQKGIVGTHSLLCMFPDRSSLRCIRASDGAFTLLLKWNRHDLDSISCAPRTLRFRGANGYVMVDSIPRPYLWQADLSPADADTVSNLTIESFPSLDNNSYGGSVSYIVTTNRTGEVTSTVSTEISTLSFSHQINSLGQADVHGRFLQASLHVAGTYLEMICVFLDERHINCVEAWYGSFLATFKVDELTHQHGTSRRIKLIVAHGSLIGVGGWHLAYIGMGRFYLGIEPVRPHYSKRRSPHLLNRSYYGTVSVFNASGQVTQGAKSILFFTQKNSRGEVDKHGEFAEGSEAHGSKPPYGHMSSICAFIKRHTLLCTDPTAGSFVSVKKVPNDRVLSETAGYGYYEGSVFVGYEQVRHRKRAQ